MTVTNTEQLVPASGCLNCAAPLTGPFCAACGQRDIPPYPSAKDLVVDAFWELSGWDGRFASTVKALVQQPGLLTREFLEGRRARYISPLRLYLMASLVYFVLAAAAPSTPSSQTKIDETHKHDTKVSVTMSRPEQVANAASRALTDETPLPADQREMALRSVERAPALLRPMMRRAIGDPGGFKRGLLDAMPRMLFVLLPVFAGIVALFYRGRKYPEHLYFAIHVHAFIFLAFCVSTLIRFTHVALLSSLSGVVALVWIPVYATMAFRRVYGGSLTMTVAKEIAIAALYCVVSTIALLVTIYLVSIAS